MMKRKIIRAAKIASLGIGAILLFSIAFILSVYAGFFGHIPSSAELKQIENEQASLVFSSDGALIGKYFSENRTNVAMDDIPHYLIDALVATEDKRFFQHHGIDRRSYFRVLFRTILLGDRSGGGGSTISQQLAKNLFGRKDYGLLSIPVTKTREAIIASRMESVYSKNEILLLYLNSVPFGEMVYGVEAAANRYFDKHASVLNLQESALLVGLLKANTYYNPRLNPDNARKRRNQVLSLMAANEKLSRREADSLSALPLGLNYSNLGRDSGFEYFVYQVRKQVNIILMDLSGEKGLDYDINKDGLRIYTTLDHQLQEFAQQASSRHLAAMQGLLDKELRSSRKKLDWEKSYRKSQAYRPEDEETSRREVFTWDGPRVVDMSRMDSAWHYHTMLNAAVLIMDPASGAVRCWVGGNHYRFLPYDLVMARHQMASVVKPLVYAAALENGMSPCTYLENTEKKYDEFQGWHPQNYDRSSTPDSLVAMWYALAHSVNLPTVDLYFKTGGEEVVKLLAMAGLDVPEVETPAVSVGALEASLYDAVRAYGMFANGGSMARDLVMIEKITDSEGNILFQNAGVTQSRVVNDHTAELITAMLEEAVTTGTGASLRSRFGIQAELAGKTGTAQDYTDAWFVAYSPEMVIGTWVGARTPDIHFSSGMGSGSALALPIAGQILQRIEQDDLMAATYLTPFSLSSIVYDELSCDPFREKGFKGFIDRMTKKDKEPSRKDLKKKDKTGNDEQKGVRKFFKKIFGKKDKK